MLHRRFLYIVNPISGTKGKQPLKQLIEAQTTEKGFAFDMVDSVPNADYSFLIPVIEQKSITDIVIAGGDGTVNGVIDSLHSLNVRFGIIPCGSGNGLAFSAGLPKNHQKALAIIFAGKALPTDAFWVNNHFACMLCGLGFDAQVAHDFAKHHKRGKGAYVNQIINNLLKAPVYNFTITTRHHTVDVEAYFISIANSNQYGNNFTIAPKASLTDGWLDIVIATRQNKLSLLMQTLKQVSGLNELQDFDGICETDNVLYFRAKKMSITNHDGAPLHIDGEPVATAPVANIAIQEEAFQLIYP